MADSWPVRRGNSVESIMSPTEASDSFTEQRTCFVMAAVLSRLPMQSERKKQRKSSLGNVMKELRQAQRQIQLNSRSRRISEPQLCL